MAVTIDATVGGAASNCYVTAAVANAYFTDTLCQAEWETWTPDERAQALITATRNIQGLYNAGRLVGTASTITQALFYPRDVDLNPDGSGYWIPPQVEDATCEQAFYLLDVRDNPDLIDRARLQSQGVSAVSLDGVSETYGRFTADVFGPNAKQLLSSLMQRSTRVLRPDEDAE